MLLYLLLDSDWLGYSNAWHKQSWLYHTGYFAVLQNSCAATTFSCSWYFKLLVGQTMKAHISFGLVCCCCLVAFLFFVLFFFRKMQNVRSSRVESTRGKQRLGRHTGLPTLYGPVRLSCKRQDELVGDTVP